MVKTGRTRCWKLSSRSNRDLTQQQSWKTQDGRMTKKCRARPEMHSLVQHFFVILPSWVFQPSCCLRSLIMKPDNPRPSQLTIVRFCTWCSSLLMFWFSRILFASSVCSCWSWALFISWQKDLFDWGFRTPEDPLNSTRERWGISPLHPSASRH